MTDANLAFSNSGRRRGREEVKEWAPTFWVKFTPLGKCPTLAHPCGRPSINKSKQICIAPCVASESEAHTGGH